MDHPDDPHALLDPSLPQDTGLAVLSAGFDADGQPPAQASDAPAGADEQQQQPGPGAHDDDDGYHPHGPGGAFQGELAPDFGQGSQPAQHGGDHPALDGPGGLLAGEPRPSASDDGLSASGGKRRRSHPHNSVELDLSTPEGQAKKKQRALRAAYMREYRKKKSTSKTTGGGKCVAPFLPPLLARPRRDASHADLSCLPSTLSVAAETRTAWASARARPSTTTS